MKVSVLESGRGWMTRADFLQVQKLCPTCFVLSLMCQHACPACSHPEVH